MTVLEEIDQIRAYLSGPGQPFELIEQDVLGQKLPVYRHVPKNLSTIVTSAAAVGVYLLLAWLFRVNEVSKAWRMVATKIPGLRGRSG